VDCEVKHRKTPLSTKAKDNFKLQFKVD